MSKARTVLICLDTSLESCLSVLKDFVEKYYKPDDTIVLLTIFDYSSVEPPVTVAVDEVNFNFESWRTALKESRELILTNHNRCREFLRKHGIQDKNVDTLMCESTDGVGTVICTEAQKMGIDMVFMGKHMKGMIGRVFIGSNSTYVAHHNVIPTVFITVTG
ncbi:hypothetical protein RF11_07323 [Thelohanellus kitauei]|uniref:UspA domain-containing protein n=1 Tax=Thelohanellus kitauei TaxID=669202 RepID=A0A0C2MKG7_THEKT|nr:hypothetical protein RF11_07323 [Thelohanellus kitauei]